MPASSSLMLHSCRLACKWIALIASTLQKGARAQQAGASTSYAAPNAFSSFASQAGQEAPASQGSGLYRMFGGEQPFMLSAHLIIILLCMLPKIAAIHSTVLRRLLCCTLLCIVNDRMAIQMRLLLTLLCVCCIALLHSCPSRGAVHLTAMEKFCCS